MDKNQPEVFGTADQQQMQRRVWALWQLVGDDPAYCTHGRTVGLAHHSDDNVPRQVALSRLLGASACEQVPGADLAARIARLEAAGLTTDCFVEWYSSDRTQGLAQSRLDGRALPDDLDVVSLDADTPDSVMAALDTLTQACDVLLPLGPFMRGMARPAVCSVALEPEGRAVGAAASVAMFHPASDLAGTCWWGMLSTHPDRRGQGIASWLGAQVLIEMQRRFGYGHFFTGIRTGNAPSEALCAGFGFAASDQHVVLGIDPAAISGGRITK